MSALTLILRRTPTSSSRSFQRLNMLPQLTTAFAPTSLISIGHHHESSRAVCLLPSSRLKFACRSNPSRVNSSIMQIANGPEGTKQQPLTPLNSPPGQSFSSLSEKIELGEDGLPIIEEEDLEEQFVRGSGPGGQKINKTASCVVLKHKPTGILVRCQESRSQIKNRELARKILQRKLDEIVRGEESEAARELSKARARKAKRRRKSVKKHFKSRRDKLIMDSRVSDW